ncbi:tetratricopeptide repeat protein [Salibacteraceae bacterium]|nr:tetratricopeptide repeat protein [Salibacteraceae bacterium]
MRKLLVIGLVAVLIASCAENGADVNSERDGVTSGVQSKEDRQAEIQELEKEISSMAKSERTEAVDAKAERLLKRYRDYVGQNPRDSITAEYLFRAADLSVGVGKYEASIAYIDRIHKDFPKFRKSVEMWLFKGFIYETYLNNHAKAVESYTNLIKKYPNHRLAADARSSIDNLTLTEEELIKKFKALNADKEI